MRVLTWNLYHGRSRPPAGRELLEEFGAAIAGWEWDVALLQEVPPWWPLPLARRCEASMRMCITGRNQLMFVREWAARRWPDVLKSAGGGANAILVRGQPIGDHREQRLRWLPERRWMHAVRLADGTWVANIHADQQPRHRPEGDIARSAAALEDWAGGAPIVFGGDFNIPDPHVPGMAGLGRGVDHVLARGLAVSDLQRLRAGRLPDHPPLTVRAGR